jgi:hypothetical protein
MKTNDFNQAITSTKLKENLEKQFGTTVNLGKYSREQLEDIRNKLRTRVFQQEGTAGINDLLTNETYQKDKAMLQLLNTRIKEMLGENIKQLRDKMVELSEGKKDAKAKKDYDGDGKIETGKEEHAGSVDKAIKKAKAEKAMAEGFPTVADAQKKHATDKKPKSKFDSKKISTGTVYQRKADKETDDEDDTVTKKVKESNIAEAKPANGMVAKEKTAAKKAKIGKSGEKVEKAVAKGDTKTDAAMMKLRAKKTAKNESTDLFRANVRMVNEGLGRFLAEDEEAKAKAITAAGDMVNDFTSWMQRVGQYQTKSMIELADAIKADFGVEQAEAFKSTVGPALSATLEVLTSQREAVSNAVAALASGEPTVEPMGQEPGLEAGMDPEMDPGMDQASPDEMNSAPEDEFSASDAGSGAGTSGREMRESAPQRRARKLAESHSIMAKLSK